MRSIISLMVALIISSVIPVFPFQNKANQREKVILVKSRGHCNFDGREINVNREVYAFDSDQEAEAVIDRIMKYTGAAPNFVIKAATVDNAEATIETKGNDLIRVIYYNREFIRTIKRTSGTDWGPISVMAHEVGHHLSSHTLKDVFRDPDKKITKAEIDEFLQTRRIEEMQADRFSGYNLCRQGATLDQAQAAIKSFGTDQGSPTHPGKKQRMDAIEDGWTSAGCKAANPPETLVNTGPKSTPPSNSVPPPPSGSETFQFNVFHEHAGFYLDLNIGNGRNSRSSSNSNGETKWGDGVLTISAIDLTVGYKEISGDRNPEHNFQVSCQTLNKNLKLNNRQYQQGMRVLTLPLLHLKANGKNYNFVGYQRQGTGMNNQLADTILRKIVEACKL